MALDALNRRRFTGAARLRAPGSKEENSALARKILVRSAPMARFPSGGSAPAVGALALIFVFFLPLHVHFSLGAQLNKECSCFQGVRTQLAPSAAAEAIVP